MGHLGSILRLGRSPGGGHGNPLQCSCLENSMDRGAWWAMVHGVAKSQTRLKRISTCEYRMQIRSILHLPIKHLHSPVLSHRTLRGGDTELSSVLSPLSPVWTSQTRFGLVFGKSGPQKMKSSTSDCVGLPRKLMLVNEVQLYHITS